MKFITNGAKSKDFHHTVNVKYQSTGGEKNLVVTCYLRLESTKENIALSETRSYLYTMSYSCHSYNTQIRRMF